MRAEQGKTYVQILHGKAHWLFTASELPEWNEDDIEVVDVTGSVPAIGARFTSGAFVVDAPVFDADMAMGRLHAKRDLIFDAADRGQLTLLSKGDQAGASTLEDCKQALRDLPGSPDVAAMLADPAMTDSAFDHAMLAKYRAIVAPMPAAVQAAVVKAALS